LRVSVTDRCNLPCSYCMPAEGQDWLPGPALLTDDEVSRLISVAVQRLDVTVVRFTGGEPLLPRGLPGLVAALGGFEPVRTPPEAAAAICSDLPSTASIASWLD
jgi:GTP 3',8-cyclase